MEIRKDSGIDDIELNFELHFKDKNREFSPADKTSEFLQLIDEVFQSGDRDNDGRISVDELAEACKIPQSLAEALIRSISSNSVITREELTAFFHVLRHGTLRQKVKILHSFIDVDGSGVVSQSEFQSFLEVKNERIMKELGYNMDDSTSTYGLTEDKLLGTKFIITSCFFVILILLPLRSCVQSCLFNLIKDKMQLNSFAREFLMLSRRHCHPRRNREISGSWSGKEVWPSLQI